jgi:hypothetical protein
MILGNPADDPRGICLVDSLQPAPSVRVTLDGPAFAAGKHVAEDIAGLFDFVEDLDIVIDSRRADRLDHLALRLDRLALSLDRLRPKP